eukprot:583432_1
MRLVALICIFLVVIEGEPCNQSFIDTKIGYITDHLNDAHSRSNVYSIYYLGTKLSATDCLESCIDFNYLCDKSPNNIYMHDEPSGSSIWEFNNSSCSITISIDDQTLEAWGSLTPNITANEYIIDLQLSIPTNSRDAGVTFKANNYGYTSYNIYLNAVDDVVTRFYYTDHINGQSWVEDDLSKNTIDWNVIHDVQVHVTHDKYTVSLNGQQIYLETDSFPPEYGGANYAGIYIYDEDASTTATYHSFRVRYPDSSDNDDEFVCAAYVFDNGNNDCFGYYGNDYSAIENSLSVDTTHASGILYDICPSTSYPTSSPTKSLTKQPSHNPTETPIVDHTEAPMQDPTQYLSHVPSVSPTKSPLVPTHKIIASHHSNRDLTPSIHSTHNMISATTETKEINFQNAPKRLGTWWLWLIVIISFVAVMIAGGYVFYVVHTRVSTQNKAMGKECINIMSVTSQTHTIRDAANGSTGTCFHTKGHENNEEREGVNENKMVNQERLSLSEGPKQHATRDVSKEAMITTKYEVNTSGVDIDRLANKNIGADEFIVCADDDEQADTNTNQSGYCVDCASENSGKMYDGLFYCNECYHKYYS